MVTRKVNEMLVELRKITAESSHFTDPNVIRNRLIQISELSAQIAKLVS